jgi:Di-haem oxidoreductase, putative peroxidase
MPRPGGGGDNVANVFVLAQLNDFTNDISGNTANERNTLGMWGSGAIEMLAREMTADLLAIRQAALQQAESSGQPVTLPLVTKGISFGQITARPNGSTDDTGIEGVDRDLIIKPFHQKGVVISLRQFTVNAFNHHHGMQASERFGDGVDFDKDGVADELTRGDITAATVFQAAMEMPGRVIPRHPVIEQAIRAGEATFQKIGCASCHVPALTLNSPIYSEPNPYNPPGNLRLQDVARAFTFDLTRQGPLPRLERTADGKAIVRAFTDLKRHKMGPLCNNEKLVQAGVPTDQFITKKLWGFYSEPPFLHSGRCTTVTEALLVHGGDAQGARDAFAALPKADRDNVIEFLKSLQVLPAGSRTLVVDETGQPR